MYASEVQINKWYTGWEKIESNAVHTFLSSLQYSHVNIPTMISNKKCMLDNYTHGHKDTFAKMYTYFIHERERIYIPHTFLRPIFKRGLFL